jgi:hypothetical protein
MFHISTWREGRVWCGGCLVDTRLSIKKIQKIQKQQTDLTGKF